MARYTIDPITRVEGHLRIDVEIESGKVKDAWSSAQLFRGLEIILKGRDPRDAHLFTQRTCGVCTSVHSQVSIRAVENALGVTPPPLARLVRNLIHGAHIMHDHITHFYALHALDWVDITLALRADPLKTSQLAQQLGDYPHSGSSDFKAVQTRIKTFIDSGQLGPFANGYWGHSDYRLPPEANLLAVAHYLEALRLQVKLGRMVAMFGGKHPHIQSLVVGGVSCVRDINPERLAEFNFYLKEVQNFVNNVYLPDLLAVASYYKDWGAIGGTTNFLAYGNFPQKSGLYPDEDMCLPAGVIMNRDLGKVAELDLAKITEEVKRAWYQDGEPLHPSQGETLPVKPEFDPDGKYSFLKSPRYDGKSTEVGPLAQVLVAYAKGHKPTVSLVDSVLKYLDVPAAALFSTLGRTAARAVQTKIVADLLPEWINEVVERLKAGDNKTVSAWQWKGKAMGVGLLDVPRGGLGHWINIDAENKIENFQMVVPTTWNFGPRDAQGAHGPLEEALLGTPVADPKRPVEILRTVHSFDPCLACGVHVMDPQTNEVHIIKAL